MEDLSVVLAIGDLLIIETGEYSDSSWHGPVRVVKAFSKQEVADRYKAEWVPNDWYDEPNPGDFLPWLVTQGYVEHVDNVTAWHVGSYGSFEP